MFSRQTNSYPARMGVVLELAPVQRDVGTMEHLWSLWNYKRARGFLVTFWSRTMSKRIQRCRDSNAVLRLLKPKRGDESWRVASGRFSTSWGVTGLSQPSIVN